MLKQLVLVATMVLPAQAETMVDRQNNFTQEVMKNIDDIERQIVSYQKSLKTSCSKKSPRLDKAIDDSAGLIRRNQSMAENESDRRVIQAHRNLSNTLSNDLADIIFRAADSSLKAKCYEAANYYYRKIVSLFIGSSYAAQRQRAQIGIDDVRQASHGPSKSETVSSPLAK